VAVSVVGPSIAVAVLAVRLFPGVVIVVDDIEPRGRQPPREDRMARIDAGVEHRHDDAGAARPQQSGRELDAVGEGLVLELLDAPPDDPHHHHAHALEVIGREVLLGGEDHRVRDQASDIFVPADLLGAFEQVEAVLELVQNPPAAGEDGVDDPSGDQDADDFDLVADPSRVSPDVRGGDGCGHAGREQQKDAPPHPKGPVLHGSSHNDPRSGRTSRSAKGLRESHRRNGQKRV